MVDPVLSVTDLQVEFQRGTERISAVRGVSFQLQAGKVLGIIGESGSGKSATCSAILGLLGREGQIAGGTIHLGQQELTNLPRTAMRQIRGQQIGVVLQNPSSFFNPILTIGRQFTETLRSHYPLSRSEAHAIALEHLSAVGLSYPQQICRQFPFQLSGGMLQRVMIAIALSLHPSVLIADEPTTALDVITQMQILNLLADLRRQYDSAILLVTHDLGVIAQLADEVAVMYQGQFVEYAPVEELFDRPQHPYTRSLLASRLVVRR
ncbi:ABC transporter ATP-binding protein [Desertifilum sp. FACHB-1129]|uniref:Nickel import system ATP-binding protein NikD n=1 Tax=Desertifilum tharense IPPAS B-1220 TaxID=1781255 RepID=A0A1E5QIC0_9CYAN|nr:MULTISPECIES: ABC transporter ATP-binding protein [Desertifilum]MBD2314400.1 ABC transporter ATP-binding protein [Desertifilum sp. FACHB-1129]MDA0212037.1 ABC transporter ATP-binding protein [Cyanobacteria bacterium FC1]MBD2324905.1 ABC transporter ATP-binding protein [Desertifilum sp. FACHB-866]MBD2334998.1 ABC transporter ATP-binding protein [Desertifilum sp. FACHB-868]OEJ74344.1 nickel import ATP-binding protein NikD [Desertifilum tharense IPPAS B-1220]